MFRGTEPSWTLTEITVIAWIQLNHYLGNWPSLNIDVQSDSWFPSRLSNSTFWNPCKSWSWPSLLLQRIRDNIQYNFILSRDHHMVDTGKKYFMCMSWAIKVFLLIVSRKEFATLWPNLPQIFQAVVTNMKLF